MTTLHQIADELYMLQATLDQATEDMIHADERVVHAEQAYRVSYARAYMEASGTVQQREQQTALATDMERFELDMAKQQLRAARAKIEAVRSQIDVGRTLSAMTRSEMALGGAIT